jgi:ABC-type multidrug transport system ATPase subunit
VKPGEMLLVLARPGGGSTSLLRILSNHRAGYSSVKSDVRFGTMDSNQRKSFEVRSS